MKLADIGWIILIADALAVGTIGVGWYLLPPHLSAAAIDTGVAMASVVALVGTVLFIVSIAMRTAWGGRRMLLVATWVAVVVAILSHLLPAIATP